MVYRHSKEGLVYWRDVKCVRCGGEPKIAHPTATATYIYCADCESGLWGVTPETAMYLWVKENSRPQEIEGVRDFEGFVDLVDQYRAALTSFLHEAWGGKDTKESLALVVKTQADLIAEGVELHKRIVTLRTERDLLLSDKKEGPRWR
jgi:hypothetical protein